MKNINKTLKYYDLFMLHSLENVQKIPLPDGYRFVYFQDGDEIEWAKIEMSAGEVLTIEEGLQAFNKSFGKHYDLMKERCLFIENEQGEKVATSTAYFTNETVGKVHWVAVKKSEQGKKLSKPLVNKTLKRLKELGYTHTLLHSQTHTWLAVKVYLDLGFMPYKIDERIEGWRIIKTLINHPALDKLETSNELYDDEFVAIDKFIHNNYPADDYKIYDKKSIFKIKVKDEIITYHYEFINKQLKIIKM